MGFGSGFQIRQSVFAEGNRGANRHSDRLRISIAWQPIRPPGFADLQRHVIGERQDGTQRSRARPDRQVKGDDAKAAFAEYARWSRERDRKCDLVEKDNVPLQELSRG